MPPRLFVSFVAACILLTGIITPAHLVVIDSTTSPTILGVKSGFFNLHFLPNKIGELTLGFPQDGDPRKGATKPRGFRIIDNTLLDFAFAPTSGRATDLRIRAGFSGRAVRAGLRRLGIRARDLRVLNYDADGKRWVRARTLRRLGQTGNKVAAASSTPVPLVWAVTNQSAGLFAVAARVVPEPTTLLLGATGLMLFARTRRARVAN